MEIKDQYGNVLMEVTTQHEGIWKEQTQKQVEDYMKGRAAFVTSWHRDEPITQELKYRIITEIGSYGNCSVSDLHFDANGKLVSLTLHWGLT